MLKSPSSDPRIGTLFGNFRIVRKLGEGGMGIVYEAENPKIQSRAAVKILHAHLAEDEEFAQRFLNEARAVNVIRNRGLVEIFDFGKLPDGTLYYVMELLNGDSLHKRLAERKGPFPQLEVIGIGVQVARALAAAHKVGIVHRDLKPENIMIEADPVNAGQDWVKILDFGIAKIRASKAQQTDPDKTDVKTQVGSSMGTHRYMPPEQHGNAEDVDGRADVFSLGVVLYELLTGHPPFKSSSLNLLVQTPPFVLTVNPAVSVRLSKLIAKMMAARRDDRPTMEEVATQLSSMLPAAVRNAKRLMALTGVLGIVVGAVLILLLSIDRVPTPSELRNRSHEVLAGYLNSSDAQARLLSVRAIGQSRDLDQRSLLDPLVRVTGKLSPDAVGVSKEAARALGLLGAADATSPLLALLSRTEAPALQLAAAGALAQLQHPRGLEALRQLFGEGDELTKVQAALMLMEHRDFGGAPLLWASVTRGRLSEERRIEVLGRLARSDDDQAKQRLAEDLARLPSGEPRVKVAYALAQLGEDSGWAELKSAAMKTGALGDQLLALRLLAALGDTEQESKLVELVRDRKQPDSVREQAMAGLADGSHHSSLAPLSKSLDERGASARLRIAAAGAILQITAGELARLGEQSLHSARAALGSDSMAMRELAVAMLAEMNSPQAVELLGEALRDREKDIRRSAASALGKKSLRGAVVALKPALQDSDPEVRSLAVQSIGQIAQTLGQRGDSQAAGPVVDELRRLSAAGSESDRLVASGVLLQLGEAQSGERTVLREGLSSKDANQRRLAIELGDADRPTLISALKDPDGKVRLAAAHRLAKQGHHDGADVLRTEAASGDREGLLAYVTLRKLGEDVPPPPGLGSLLTSGDVSTRLVVLGFVRDLPMEDAGRLVKIALLDPIPVVRRRAAEVSAELYRTTRLTRYLRIVRSLRNDPDVSVRAQATVLTEELEQFVKSARPIDLGTSVAEPLHGKPENPPPTKQAPPALPGMGELIAEGEELVRFQIDKGPHQVITGRPIAIPVGKHRISFLGGGQDVMIQQHQPVRLRIPVLQADQFCQDAKDALGRKDLLHAQENLDKLRRLVQRGKASQSLQADLSFQQARLFEARDQLDAALIEYNRALNIPANQRRADLNTALQSALSRLSSRVSRIQVFTMVDGRCVMSRELLSPPGQQQISIGNGQTRTVYATVGSVNKVTACQ